MKLFTLIITIFLWLVVIFGIYGCILIFNNPDAMLGGIRVSNGGFPKALSVTIIYSIFAGFLTALYYEAFVKE